VISTTLRDSNAVLSLGGLGVFLVFFLSAPIFAQQARTKRSNSFHLSQLRSHAENKE
jgi:hypothetical protein